MGKKGNQRTTGRFLRRRSGGLARGNQGLGLRHVSNQLNGTAVETQKPPEGNITGLQSEELGVLQLEMAATQRFDRARFHPTAVTTKALTIFHRMTVEVSGPLRRVERKHGADPR